jgi:hypothetical protein
MLNIKPLYFFASFALGILLVYMMTPPPEIVVKWPSPYNAGKVTYKDKSNTCYKYKAENVPCENKDGVSVAPQPIMEDFKLQELFNNVF